MRSQTRRRYCGGAVFGAGGELVSSRGSPLLLASARGLELWLEDAFPVGFWGVLILLFSDFGFGDFGIWILAILGFRVL